MPPKKRKIEENLKREWNVGEFVWAKTSNSSDRFWPGIIVDHTDGGFSKPKLNNVWIFWFGDHRVSEVNSKNVFSFEDNFGIYYKHYLKYNKTRQPKTLKQGILQAIKEFGQNRTINWNDKQLINWALHGFPKTKKNETIPVGIPEFVKNKLTSFKEKNLELESISQRSSITAEDKTLAEKIKKKEIPLNDICIGCFSREVSDEHPIFHAYLCKNCKVKIKHSLYVVGDDKVSYYCTICATLGDMFVCDQEKCGRVFCRRCIKLLGHSDAELCIEKQKQWLCFVCEPAHIKRVTNILKIRSDWTTKVQAILVNTQNNIIPIPKFSVKKKLRVLSLFDGIATGFLALKELNLEIEKYYSVEIDEDALNVVRLNHGSDIINLGDIKNFGYDSIKKLCPIDLLIGGSPCNDLSFVNPNRKGLYEPSGSGILFFDFYRVLMVLNKENGAPFFWLFENVAAMPIEYKISISRFLECEPVILDAVHWSAHKRTRLFWGNLPSLTQYSMPDDGPELQKYLMPGRIATLNKAKCLTTARNSLEQGIVLNQDNSPDVLWITEIERMFGLPLHYTDTGNLSLNKRQKLIGRSWSVQVIKYLFRCLDDYYLTKENHK